MKRCEPRPKAPRIHRQSRHPRAGGDPARHSYSGDYWIPACAGMTIVVWIGTASDRKFLPNQPKSFRYTGSSVCAEQHFIVTIMAHNCCGIDNKIPYIIMLWNIYSYTL
jgi:hypothetical protein